MSVSIFPPQSFCTRLSTSRDGGQCCGFFKMDLLCSDQFLLEDDLILTQIADMAEDDTDQIMCSQVQTLKTQYWNNIELSQTVTEMLSGLPASPDVNSDTNFDLKFETSDINLPKIKTEETESGSRFAAPVGESEIRKLLENQESPNTRKNTNWAYNVFLAWSRRGVPVSRTLRKWTHQLWSFGYRGL